MSFAYPLPKGIRQVVPDYTCDGVHAPVLAIPFRFFDPTDIFIGWQAAGQPSYATFTPFTLNVDYSISGAGLEAGGTATFTTIPPAGVIRVMGLRTPSRLTSVVNDGEIIATAFENELDVVEMTLQEVRRDASFAVTIADSADVSAVAAVATANNALTTANGAVTTANAADATANAASATAGTALTTANAAAASAATAVTEATASTNSAAAYAASAAASASVAAAIAATNYAVWPSRAAFAATSVASPILLALIAGYAAAGDAPATLYVKLGSPPSPVKPWHVQTADGAWWQLKAAEADVRLFLADPTGVIDSTTAINNAIAYGATFGVKVKVIAGTYLVNGTLNITTNGVAIEGAGVSVTNINFGASSADCIVVGAQVSQIAGFLLRGMTLNCGSRTAGRAIYFDLVAYCNLEDLVINSVYDGIDFYIINTVTLDNVLIQGVRHQWGLFYRAPTDGSGRSDGLTQNNVVVQCLYSGADGMWWDGAASAMNGNNLIFLECRYGLWIKNTALSGVYFPQFGEFNNLITDGMLISGLRIDAGSSMQFVNSYIQNTSIAPSTTTSGPNPGPQGGLDTYAMQMFADLGNSYTNNFEFVNCQFGTCGQDAVYVGGRDVTFNGCTFTDGGKVAANTYDAVLIATGAQDIKMIGCKISAWGSVNYWRYGYNVATGVQRIELIGCTGQSAMTRAVNWQTSDAASFCDLGSTGANIAYRAKPSAPFSLTLSGSLTLTAAEMLGGVLNLAGTGGFTLTSLTAAQIVAATVNPFFNACLDWLVVNSTTTAVTLSAGSGVTVIGNLASASTMTIAGQTQRLFRIILINTTPGSEAVTIYG